MEILYHDIDISSRTFFGIFWLDIDIDICMMNWWSRLRFQLSTQKDKKIKKKWFGCCKDERVVSQKKKKKKKD